MIELGDQVKCKITNFSGTVIGIMKCLTGCDRVDVRPGVDKHGKMQDGFMFDIYALELVKKGKVKPENVQSENPLKKGGPPTRSPHRL